MGLCASSPSEKTNAAKGKRDAMKAAESFRRPSTIMVMDLQGRIKEFEHPIPASSITSHHPNCFLCNSESIYIGTCIPRVPDDEQLRPGQIYFLVPLSGSQQALSLPALCDLAIKASSALPL